MLFTGCDVRMRKTDCARSLENGPSPKGEGRLQDQGHSFSQPDRSCRKITCLFFIHPLDNNNDSKRQKYLKYVIITEINK